MNATIAGVAIGLLTRVVVDPGEAHRPAESLEHRMSPIPAYFAVPAFALMSVAF